MNRLYVPQFLEALKGEPDDADRRLVVATPGTQLSANRPALTLSRSLRIVRSQMSRRCRGVRGWPLIVLGMVLVLGHVCELPVEALTMTGHAEAGECDRHGDSVHAGSCEAVTTVGGMSSAVQLVVGDLPLSDLPVPTHDVARDLPSASSSPSPPLLFLLHVVLLI